MNDPVLGPIDQIGYVVADLDRSIARWRGRHDVGPWAAFRIHAAELLAPTTERPFRDFVALA
nr:hypothetical protein [Burkholderia cepacia]